MDKKVLIGIICAAVAMVIIVVMVLRKKQAYSVPEGGIEDENPDEATEGTQIAANAWGLSETEMQQAKSDISYLGEHYWAYNVPPGQEDILDRQTLVDKVTVASYLAGKVGKDANLTADQTSYLQTAARLAAYKGYTLEEALAVMDNVYTTIENVSGTPKIQGTSLKEVQNLARAASLEGQPLTMFEKVLKEYGPPI